MTLVSKAQPGFNSSWAAAVIRVTSVYWVPSDRVQLNDDPVTNVRLYCVFLKIYDGRMCVHFNNRQIFVLSSVYSSLYI